MFSAKERTQRLQKMAEKEHDLLIIGGGITGAGIALDASSRGMSTALVEMQDFAAGTSSRSTKLVHGGLRYLKQFEFNIVRETGRERAVVYENGPHVTQPEWMILPFYKGGTLGPLTTAIGLTIYDRLAGVKKSERRKMLNVDETLQKEPLVKKEGLKGSGYYVEYRTDDARLTIEVLKKAIEFGANPVNYTKAEGFLYDSSKKIIGAIVRDLLSGKEYEIRAKKVVNATGPWVDDVRKMDYARNNKKLRLTKGIHIVFDQSVFPLRQAVYFDTPDGRMVFAIPRDGKTYVGTTDTFYDANKANPKMTKADLDYLIGTINYIFPSVNIKREHLESSWAGLRPLIYEEGKDPSAISRKDEIWNSESGLITIAGGKLTGYRKMAESVVNLVAKILEKEYGMTFKSCLTYNMPISGGNVGGSKNFANFIEEKGGGAIAYGLTEEEGKFLARKYGSNVDILFRYAKERENDSSLPPIIYSQLMYAIHHEMATKPTDFFIRRTGALYFNLAWVKEWKGQVLEEMAKILDWSEELTKQYKEELEAAIVDATNPVESD